MDDRGIDKTGLNKQITNIEYYVAELKTELDNITGYINSLNSYYIGDGANKIVSRYNDISSRYDTMYVKLNKLKNELTETIQKYEIASQKIYGDIPSAQQLKGEKQWH